MAKDETSPYTDRRDAAGFMTMGVLGIAARVIGSAALVDAGGLLIWREWVFNPTCARTPMGEISGNPLLQELLVSSVFLIRAGPGQPVLQLG